MKHHERDAAGNTSLAGVLWMGILSVASKQELSACTSMHVCLGWFRGVGCACAWVRCLLSCGVCRYPLNIINVYALVLNACVSSTHQIRSCVPAWSTWVGVDVGGVGCAALAATVVRYCAG